LPDSLTYFLGSTRISAFFSLADIILFKCKKSETIIHVHSRVPHDSNGYSGNILKESKTSRFLECDVQIKYLLLFLEEGRIVVRI